MTSPDCDVTNFALTPGSSARSWAVLWWHLWPSNCAKNSETTLPPLLSPSLLHLPKVRLDHPRFSLLWRTQTGPKKSSCLFEYGEWTVQLKTTFSPHSSYVSEIHRLECSNRQIYSSCARYALLLWIFSLRPNDAMIDWLTQPRTEPSMLDTHAGNSMQFHDREKQKNGWKSVLEWNSRFLPRGYIGGWYGRHTALGVVEIFE